MNARKINDETVISVAASDWVLAIRQRWQDTVGAILDVGRLLIEAKASLPRGEFTGMFKPDRHAAVGPDQVPFTLNTGEILMIIARHPVLSKSEHVQTLPSSWGTLYELSKLGPLVIEAAIASRTIHSEMDRAEAIKLRDPLGVHFSSDTPEWYTPPEIIKATLTLFGSIDLDPCSNSGPVPNIPSACYFTQADDGLAQPWNGRVYMNPPYGRVIDAWVDKLCAEYASGRATEAIALVPARVDTDWFRKFRDNAICFVDGRLKFSGHENSAPFPSAAVYLGGRLDAFYDAFAEMGDVWVRWQK